MKLLRNFCLVILIPLAAGCGWVGSGPSGRAPAAPAKQGPFPVTSTSKVANTPSAERPPSGESTSGKATEPALSPADSRGKAGVIVVAKQGGDCSTIQAGIEAAQKLHPSDRNRVVVLVYPGVYEEEHLDVPDYVSLQGVNREECIIRKATVQADRNHIHALVAVAGNSSISNLTLENLQKKWGISTALLLGYSFQRPGPVNGKTIRARNLTLVGEIRDVLLLLGDNDIVLEDSTVYSKGDIDTLNVKPPRKSTRYIIRRCTVRSGQGAGLFITGPGTAVFESCRFIDDAGRGTMRFVASLPAWEGTFLRFYHCSFLNGKTYAPGRAVDEVSDGKGFHASLDGCVYGSLGYRNPERLQIEVNGSTRGPTQRKP